MSNDKSGFRRPRHCSLALLAASILCLAPLIQTAGAQSGGTIDTGTTISVRTNEEIKVDSSDGRVFSAEVDQDVRDTRGQVALPRGTYAELLVRGISNNEYVVDLESVTVNGRRLGVETANKAVGAVGEKQGIGANDRTGRYVGGGAVIGAIIGAIAGGGKGAAIGGGVGAAAGAGGQLLTRGRSVYPPAESLVTFRLEQPLKTGVPDPGFSRNGVHYHSGYGTVVGNTPAYEAGLKAGRSDRERNRAFDWRSTTFRNADLRDYQDGYERGFDESISRPQKAAGTIRIGADHYVTWKGPAASQVYVQVDDNPRRLFSAEASGSHPAPWITTGHKYVFVLEDPNKKEIARDENDLRQSTRRVR